MEAFVEACGDVAMDNFDPAAFDADPSAAFADTMGAVMDFMGDSEMPPEMMGNFQDVAQGCFDQYMGDNPDAAPMDAFDAVGAGIDHHMADMPPDMPCADMAGEMPPPPGDFGPFMDECPPWLIPGGESYDPGAHPHEGGMADMMGPPPGDMAGPPPGEGGPPPGDMAGGPDMPPPGDMGPGPDGPPPGDMGPGGQIHYLDQVNLPLQVDQMGLLLELIWMATEWLHRLQVIWDQETDQWTSTRWMGKCILIWMTQVLTMDQDLRDQTGLLLELIWMATEWLRLHHLMIQPMM